MRSRYRACGAAEADARACGAARAAQSQYENIGALTSFRYKQQICDSKRGGAGGGAAVGVRRNAQLLLVLILMLLLMFLRADM